MLAITNVSLSLWNCTPAITGVHVAWKLTWIDPQHSSIFSRALSILIVLLGDDNSRTPEVFFFLCLLSSFLLRLGELDSSFETDAITTICQQKYTF